MLGHLKEVLATIAVVPTHRTVHGKKAPRVRLSQRQQIERHIICAPCLLGEAESEYIVAMWFLRFCVLQRRCLWLRA